MNKWKTYINYNDKIIINIELSMKLNKWIR